MLLAKWTARSASGSHVGRVAHLVSTLLDELRHHGVALV
jgi:hypothetical protein